VYHPHDRKDHGLGAKEVGKESAMKANKTMFVLGLLIVFSAAALLLLDVIESGVAAAIGILGIGLIAASGRTNTKSKS
jgi:hypothetical protein